MKSKSDTDIVTRQVFVDPEIAAMLRSKYDYTYRKVLTAEEKNPPRLTNQWRNTLIAPADSNDHRLMVNIYKIFHKKFPKINRLCWDYFCAKSNSSKQFYFEAITNNLNALCPKSCFFGERQDHGLRSFGSEVGFWSYC